MVSDIEWTFKEADTMPSERCGIGFCMTNLDLRYIRSKTEHTDQLSAHGSNDMHGRT
jgi:hypothetical protein